MTTATKPKYKLVALINGETVTKLCDDLNEAVASLKPEWLHTEVYITVTRGKKRAERRLTLINARRVFNDDAAREVFINNLLLT